MKTFNYVGPLNRTGYGIASIGYLNQLIKDNPTISVNVISKIDQIPDYSQDVLRAIENKPDYTNPTFCFWHLHDMPNQISSFKGKKVGFTTFEVDALSSKDTAVLHQFDSLGTASNWGKSILEKYTDKPISVIPHAFKSDDSTPVEKYNPSRVSIDTWKNFLAPANLPSDTLILGTAGKFESRKGHPELIEACIEYAKDHPVLLVAFLFNPFLPGNFPYSYINYKMMYPVFTNYGLKLFKKNNFYMLLMPPTNTRLELHNALMKTHYFISPSKGEGWNLPLFEMMSCGMPSITTLYSAHTDYCTTDNVVPVEFDGLVTANDGMFFNGVGSWANVTKSNILSSIKTAHSNLSNTKFIENLSNNSVLSTSRFTWQKEARKIQSLMNQL